MKKIKYVISFVLVCIMMLVTVSGSDSGTLVIEYTDDDITVVFENAAGNNEEFYKRIADRLVYGDEYSTSKLSWCWLFGHNIQTNTVNVTTHNVRSVSPKCLRNTYNVETCSKCDYYNEELIASAYIVCH